MTRSLPCRRDATWCHLSQWAEGEVGGVIDVLITALRHEWSGLANMFQMTRPWATASQLLPLKWWSQSPVQSFTMYNYQRLSALFSFSDRQIASPPATGAR